MKKTLLIIGLAGICASSAFATDLWNQMAGASSSNNGYVNQVFSDFPTYSSFGVSDVIASSNWNISSVSIAVYPYSGSISTGLLNVFANTGALPGAGDDPTTGTTVNLTATAGTGNLSGFTILTASGLNINLAAGEYWIGLTPNTSFANNGEPFLVYSSGNAPGANYEDAWINPGGSFGLGTSWGSVSSMLGLADGPAYGAIDINGTVQAVPAPASIIALGIGVLGLALLRRKA